MAILSNVSSGEWALISSEFLDFEIGKIPDPERRNNVQYLSNITRLKVSNNESIEARQTILEKMGFQPLDAFHIASAEKAQVEILLTTDDEMLKIYCRHQKQIKIRIENPVRFLMEVTTP
jgi:predicted nucleic acid-binding protein